MFRVQYCHLGDGIWNRSAPPVTLQAAIGQARIASDRPMIQGVRIVPAVDAQGSTGPLVNLLV